MMPSAKRRVSVPKELGEYDKTEWKPNGTPRSGWGPIPYEFWDHIPRLRSGAVQGDLLWYLCRLTFGLEPDRRDADWPQWTPWVRWDSLAERLHACVKMVQVVAKDASHRAGGAIIDIEERRGEVRFRLLWRTWSKLKDYEDVPRPVLVVPEKQAEPVAMFERPFTVRAGKKRKVKVFEDREISLCPVIDTAFQIFQESDKAIRIDALAPDSAEGPTQNQSDTTYNRKHISDSVSVYSPKEKAKVSLPAVIVEACAPFGLVNDGPILQLIADCQSYAPCTVEEIAAEVRRVGESAPAKMRNVAGLIIKQVPQFFNSSAYKSGIAAGSGRSETLTPEQVRIARRSEALRRMSGGKLK